MDIKIEQYCGGEDEMDAIKSFETPRANLGRKRMCILPHFLEEHAKG
jgi:hypothetical protein